MSFLKLPFARQLPSALPSDFILNPPRGSSLQSLRSPTFAKSEIQVDCFRSIHEVSETFWDSILPADNQFHRHRFIRVVEDADLEDSTFWYLLFKDKTGLAGTAVLCSFRVSLDLFIGGWVSGLAKSVRRRFPNFLRPLILFCGLPVSLGQRA